MMPEVRLQIYSVFLNHVFIRGWITSLENQPTQISLYIGGGCWEKIERPEAEDGWFANAFPFEEQCRSELFPPKLKFKFDNGDGQILDDATMNVLGEESFWRYLHPVLESLRKLKSGRFLEIGSRARSGISRRELLTPVGWEYVGFDVLEGENVDVVGDAHELSSYFPPDHFDAIGAFAVLEHILMPWKLAVELNKVMKIGAVGFFVTHQSYPIHDEPWDFWRYSDRAWQSILNVATGFEIIEAKMSEPAFLVAKHGHAAVDTCEQYVGYLSSVVVFRKVRHTALRWDVKLGDITSSQYPKGELPLIER